MIQVPFSTGSPNTMGFDALLDGSQLWLLLVPLQLQQNFQTYVRVQLRLPARESAGQQQPAPGFGLGSEVSWHHASASASARLFFESGHREGASVT